jgi:hypothetical protein
MESGPTDRGVKRQQLRWQRENAIHLQHAVESLIATYEGRRYLHWLLQIGRALGENPFTGQALSTSFACGEQNVGQQIMGHLLEVSPEGFMTVLKEGHARATEQPPVAGGEQHAAQFYADDPEPGSGYATGGDFGS